MQKIILTLLMFMIPLIVHAATYEITTPGNNVGIGSTNPGVALDVNGTVRATAFVTNHLGFVATGGNLPLTNTNTLFQLSSRTYHTATDNICSAQLMFPNFINNTTESGNGGSATITASIEYPVGTYNQVKFSGSASGTIPNGGSLLSDMTSLSTCIPVGAAFYVRDFYQNSSGVLNSTGFYGVSGYDSEITCTTGCIDQTMSDTNLNSSVSGTSYTPSAIIGYTSKPTILIWGDSRATGLYDVADTQDLIGYARFVGKYYGESNESYSGAYLDVGGVGFLPVHTQKLLLAKYATALVCELGINDFYQSVSLATFESNMASMAALFTIPIYWSTLEPKSTSNDNWTTLAAQSPANPTVNAVRVSFNDALRNHAMPYISNYIEIANIVESSQDSGLWIVNLTPNGYTPDGLHPNYAGNLLESNALIPLNGNNQSTLQTSGGSVNGLTLFQNGLISASNIGIGSYSPAALLDVEGTLNQGIFLNAGNVGIGTSAPGQQLDVTNNQNKQTMIRINNSNGSGASQTMLYTNNGTNFANFGLSGTGYTPYGKLGPNTGYLYSTDFVALDSDNINGYIQFLGNAGAERMRVTAAGNVGIGTNLGDSLLAVKGSNGSATVGPVVCIGRSALGQDCMGKCTSISTDTCNCTCL